MPSGLFGKYHVTPTPSALAEARKLFPRWGDYQELRKHALKLAFWPDASDPKSGKVEDLDWEWITAMGSVRAGELRVDDTIGGFNNLRVIFFPTNVKLAGEPLPRIWTIGVLQKKTQRFSQNRLRIYQARLSIVRARYQK